MQNYKYCLLSLLIPLIVSCNSEKGYYNDIYEQIDGNYEINEIKYISSTGADSSIYEVGTMYFSPCTFSKESSESFCNGTISLQNPEVNGNFTFKVQQQDVLKLDIRLEQNDFYKSLYEGLNLHDASFYFESEKFYIILADQENYRDQKISDWPYELVLSKF